MGGRSESSGASDVGGGGGEIHGTWRCLGILSFQSEGFGQYPTGRRTKQQLGVARDERIESAELQLLRLKHGTSVHQLPVALRRLNFASNANHATEESDFCLGQ